MSKAAMTILALSTLLLAATAQAQTNVLKQEPRMGALKEGEVVLVDDGRCPKGQVRRVVGGNHVEVGGTKQVKRSSSCVPR